MPLVGYGMSGGSPEDDHPLFCISLQCGTPQPTPEAVLQSFPTFNASTAKYIQVPVKTVATGLTVSGPKSNSLCPIRFAHSQQDCSFAL